VIEQLLELMGPGLLGLALAGASCEFARKGPWMPHRHERLLCLACWGLAYYGAARCWVRVGNDEIWGLLIAGALMLSAVTGLAGLRRR
jgi:hypothetical protein